MEINKLPIYINRDKEIKNSTNNSNISTLSDSDSLSKKSSRIKSVDVLRGLTIILMILVDDPAGKSFEFMRHPIWTGLSLADFIFPTFITLMGVSIYFSLGKYNFKPSWKSIFRIIRRFVLLIVIGWLISRICNYVIPYSFAGKDFIEPFFDFSEMRFLGVLQRIALCYLFGSLIVLFFHNKKAIITIIVLLLLGYAVALGLCNGYEMTEQNIISVVDRTVFGTEHMYVITDADGAKIALDPEGLFSTIPCIAQTLLGFLIGSLLKDRKKDTEIKVIYLFVIGFSLLIAGYLLGFFIPAFKKAWTSPFVLLMVGTDACMLGLFTWIIDVKGHNKWCKFFQVYGTNAIISFAAMDIVWLILAKLKITSTVYNFLVPVFFGVEGIACMLTTFLFILALWVLLYILYKKKIYIRL